MLAPLGVLAASATLIIVGATIAPKHKALALTLAVAVPLALPWLAAASSGADNVTFF